MAHGPTDKNKAISVWNPPEVNTWDTAPINLAPVEIHWNGKFSGARFLTPGTVLTTDPAPPKNNHPH